MSLFLKKMLCCTVEKNPVFYFLLWFLMIYKSVSRNTLSNFIFLNYFKIPLLFYYNKQLNTLNISAVNLNINHGDKELTKRAMNNKRFITVLTDQFRSKISLPFRRKRHIFSSQYHDILVALVLRHLQQFYIKKR